jgi:hypothetical protein
MASEAADRCFYLFPLCFSLVFEPRNIVAAGRVSVCHISFYNVRRHSSGGHSVGRNKCKVRRSKPYYVASANLISQQATSSEFSYVTMAGTLRYDLRLFIRILSRTLP